MPWARPGAGQGQPGHQGTLTGPEAVTPSFQTNCTDPRGHVETDWLKAQEPAKCFQALVL